MKGLMYLLMELEVTKDKKDAKEVLRTVDLYFKKHLIRVETYNVTVEYVKQLAGLDNE